MPVEPEMCRFQLLSLLQTPTPVVDKRGHNDAILLPSLFRWPVALALDILNLSASRDE